MEDLNPRHFKKDESARLGIQHGWYGIKVSGTLMTGPSATLEECQTKINALAGPEATARRRRAE